MTGSGQNLEQIYQADSYTTFDTIAQSLGGVVALHTVQKPHIKERTNSVVTVGSQVRRVADGFRQPHSYFLVTCDRILKLFRDILFGVYEDMDEDIHVIRSIVNEDWSELIVETVTNPLDLVVIKNLALLEGQSIHCCCRGASLLRDPDGVINEAIPIVGHSLILNEAPD